MLQLSVLCWFVKCCIFVRQWLVCYFVYAYVVVCGCARVCMHACMPMSLFVGVHVYACMPMSLFVGVHVYACMRVRLGMQNQF